jgi:hypothetical protein
MRTLVPVRVFANSELKEGLVGTHSPTVARAGCRRPARRDRRAAQLRTKRYDERPRPRHRDIPVATHPSLRTGPVRLDATVYRRRRRLIGLAVAAAVTVLSLGAQAALTGPGSGPASAAGAGTGTAPRTVRAERGDSLWSIAVDHHGSVDINRYVDKLIDLNGGRTGIEAGQLVRIP